MFASKNLPEYLPGHFDGDGCMFPDPHFTPRQHNQPNPILVDFRMYAKDAATGHYRVSSAWLARHWTQSDEMWREVTTSLESDDPIGTPEQEVHARKVLMRLANLTGVSS